MNMKVALGFKSHSGWTAMVVVGAAGDGLEIVDRQRVELIDEGETWAKQPYHAAEDLPPDEARRVVAEGTESARRVAARQMRRNVSQLKKLGHEIAGCGVLVPDPMPDWSTDEILAVHFRMHKAEGVLFPDALCKAADACGLRLVAVPEKGLDKRSELALGVPFDQSMRSVTELGRSIGPPWGKDQKSATLTAMIVLGSN